MTFLCKSHSVNLHRDYTGWWWSRKLNGFSMLWDGGISTRKPVGEIPWGKPRKRESLECMCTGLWTSDAHIIHAPKWWYKDFPQFVPLQGECWYKDEKYYASVCNSTYTKSSVDFRWKYLKFIIYNYKPYSLFKDFNLDWLSEGKKIFYPNKSFEERFKLIKQNIVNDRNTEVLNQFIIGSSASLKVILNECTRGDSTNWEGLMISNPKGLYPLQYSYDILKLKPEYDIEVKIIGYETSNSISHKGKMQSLKVALTWNEKVLSFHGGQSRHIGREVTFFVGNGFNKWQREWDYVKEEWPLGKEIKILFNEVGENGAIPSSRIA